MSRTDWQIRPIQQTGLTHEHGCRVCRLAKKGDKQTVKILGVAAIPHSLGGRADMVIYECQTCGGVGWQYWGEVIPYPRFRLAWPTESIMEAPGL